MSKDRGQKNQQYITWQENSQQMQQLEEPRVQNLKTEKNMSAR